jgi:hypothetical protein
LADDGQLGTYPPTGHNFRFADYPEVIGYASPSRVWLLQVPMGLKRYYAQGLGSFFPSLDRRTAT